MLVGEDSPAESREPTAQSQPVDVERWPFADFNWRADGAMPAVEISRDDIIQIIFTSGATAEPKGVVIRDRNVLANIVPVEQEIAKYRR